MKHIWPILLLMWRDQRGALICGAALSAVVLAMGAALLGLSGLFITPAAAAGLAGQALCCLRWAFFGGLPGRFWCCGSLAAIRLARFWSRD